MSETKEEVENRETKCLHTSFKRAVSYGKSETAKYLRDNKITWERFEDEAIRVIYGSNAIERAGGTLEYTASLCRPIFRGTDNGDEPLNARPIDETLPGYWDTVRELRVRGHQTPITDRIIVNTQRAIIHQAEALTWAIDHLVFDDYSHWTDSAIKHINRILYYGLARPNSINKSDINLPRGVVPGQYRRENQGVRGEGGAENTGFSYREGVVSRCMRAWLKEMHSEVLRIRLKRLCGRPSEVWGSMAKLYHELINVHPFAEDHRVTERIILNCLVMNLKGHLLPLGDDGEEERERYRKLASESMHQYETENSGISRYAHRGHHWFAGFFRHGEQVMCDRNRGAGDSRVMTLVIRNSKAPIYQVK